jgi:hypothetical protein
MPATTHFLTPGPFVGYAHSMRLVSYVIQLLVLGSLILMHAMESDGEISAPPPCHPPESVAQASSATGGQHNTKQLQFKVVLVGELLDEDKVHLGITDFVGSDGFGLTLIENEFPSAVAAQEYFEKVLAKALKVTERGEKKDTAGKVAGKRATAVVPTGKPDEPFPAILLTYGRDFYEIQSVSSRDSRIMEMRLTSSN